MTNGNSRLIISIEELQKILDYAKNRAEHDSMASRLVIECKNDKITITQDSYYNECNSIYHVR